MSRAAARIIASAIHGAPKRHAEEQGPGRYRASVKRWDSQSRFVLDLHGQDLELDEDDVTLGQSVRRYDAGPKIKVGDVLVLVEIDDGDFSAVDVESDTKNAGTP